MLAGKAPFPGGGIPERLYRHAHDEPPDVHLLNPRVPEALCAVVRRMLAKDPDERYPTPAALLKDLIRVASASGELSGRDVLAGLALIAEAEGSSVSRRRTANTDRTSRPSPPPRRPRPAAPEPADGPEPSARRLTAGASTIWILGGAGAGLVLVLALLAIIVGLRRPHPPRGLATEIAPPAAAPAHRGDTGRDSAQPVWPHAPEKGSTAPARP
jgi:serine/threonine-protein kinase